ncbi:MAG: methenyltetrahydromethanopterin cyclohydrolase, partial [Spirochaetota bacterium]
QRLRRGHGDVRADARAQEQRDDEGLEQGCGRIPLHPRPRFPRVGPARILEQVCHKMYENGFDVAKVTNCRGAAPVAPIVKDEVKSMGRINDALLYAGETEFWVDAEDEEIRRVIGRLSSKDSSPQYGVLFEDIFEAAGRDFYYIDHQVHSIGQIRIHSVRSGAAFSAGEYHRELIGRSFLS